MCAEQDAARFTGPRYGNGGDIARRASGAGKRPLTPCATSVRCASGEKVSVALLNRGRNDLDGLVSDDEAHAGVDQLWDILAVHAETSPSGRRGTRVWPIIMLRQREAVQNFTDEQVSLRRR
jgi:hypothetical protein